MAIDAAEAALEQVSKVLADLGLELRPEKTRTVDLRAGREGFDFVGCHFHARVSGRLLERAVRRYYLQRRPLQRSMKRIRQKVGERTGFNRSGVRDVPEIIEKLNPTLRGSGSYSEPATPPSVSPDRPVCRGSASPPLGQEVRPESTCGRAGRWTEDWFTGLGL